MQKLISGLLSQVTDNSYLLILGHIWDLAHL